VAVSAATILAGARAKLGDTYVYGADGPSTFDCSGLTQTVYKEAGISIPRTSEEQFNAGKPIDEANAVPGSLVFFGGNGYDGTPSSPGHVGIYIGGGQMIDAPHTGAVVRIDSIAGNVGFRDYGITGAGNADVLKAGIEGGLGTATGISGTSGLFSLPGEVIGFFSDADTYAQKLYHNFQLFFQPSTWVRAGSGIFGFTFVIFGLVLLSREAKGA